MSTHPKDPDDLKASPNQHWFLRHKRFVMYCLLGGIGVMADLTSFWVLANGLNLHHQMANLLSTFCGIVTSFILNATFTFQARDRWLLRFASFLLIGLFGLGLSALTLYVLVDRFGINKNWAKAACVYVVLVQYNLNRILSFRK